MDNIIVVGASDIETTNNVTSDIKSYFYDDEDNIIGKSCYGATTVDLFAPGRNIFTTRSWDDPNNTNYDDYITDQGTSMAAPFVTGVAALISSYCSNITVAELRARLMYAVDEGEALNELCVSGGRLNAYKAFHTHQFPSAWTITNNSHYKECSLCGYQDIHAHTYQYTYWTDLKHKAICGDCGYERNIAHSIVYENLGITIGHRRICSDCGHVFSTDNHFWQAQYLNGVIIGYKCKFCKVFAEYIDLPHPDFAPAIRDLLEGVEIGEDGIGILPVGEHVAIICDNGKYGLIVECDEQGKPLAKIPKGIFADDEDVDKYQKELDKKAEDLIALQEERKKTLEELFDEIK